MPKRSILFLCLVFLLAACARKTAAPPAGDRQQVPLRPGKGSLSGVVANAAETWPGMSVIYIYAAPFSGDANGQGIYYLDPSVHPQAALGAGGSFRLADLDSQRYVLMVGPRADDSRPVLDEEGRTRIVEVKAGQAIKLGQVKVGK